MFCVASTFQIHFSHKTSFLSFEVSFEGLVRFLALSPGSLKHSPANILAYALAQINLTPEDCAKRKEKKFEEQRTINFDCQREGRVSTGVEHVRDGC